MEGPAVSRTQMRIAWSLRGIFYLADIIYEDGTPKLVNKKKILDRKDLPFRANIETQNFRPPNEKEIIFSAYDYLGTEVAGVNIETGKIVNYSIAPDQYDEPEGIFPDGKYTLVESNKHRAEIPPRLAESAGPGLRLGIDIYKLALDGSGTSERLTYFANYVGYKASNPVVSDDGKYMAFQFAKRGDPAGVGRGILIFDLEMYEKMKKSNSQ